MGRLARRTGLLFLAIVAILVSFSLAQAGSIVKNHALAQTNAPPPALAPALPMVSGSFADPQGRFQIGIFEGYSVSSAGGNPLFQAADGSLAYTVAVAPLPSALTPEAALVAAAESTFGAGEGFVAGDDVQPIPGGGIRINWTGRLSQGAAPPQPITGKIFARQRGESVFLLLVAATQTAEPQLSDAINALGGTLTVP
ncbi:hypothetical protein PGN35_014015 [Nodosilinea sp. PGN35]|uniref:hypothetical protein n=1 Tax=Nodosilinea sp. PGN35 TaxID=3020489 RepID=UPI0023B20E84|nr:hypothetical protein [Nodosilinea sp. TSF1-S3]MDF0364925.1 hypothetical protein [Nodosilinea sp. TSF1-S3]